jgi:LPXTG-motif cell wall-anchored protein
MSSWLIILIIVILVAAGLLFWRSRQERHEDVMVGAASTRDYEQERKDSRNTQMSDEDRAWQEASLQKNRENQARKPPAPPES